MKMQNLLVLFFKIIDYTNDRLFKIVFNKKFDIIVMEHDDKNYDDDNTYIIHIQKKSN